MIKVINMLITSIYMDRTKEIRCASIDKELDQMLDREPNASKVINKALKKYYRDNENE